MGEEGKEPEYTCKDIRLSRCILTKDKKEQQGLRSEVLEIGS